MSKIELKVNDDPTKVGHLFCDDCATELNVVLSSSDKFYRNPNWQTGWNAEWSEYYNVRFIFPKLLKQIWSQDFLKETICPYCSYTGEILVMENGLFSANLIKESLDSDATLGYKCTSCEMVYASSKCVTSIGKAGKNIYMCGDCAIFA